MGKLMNTLQEHHKELLARVECLTKELEERGGKSPEGLVDFFKKELIPHIEAEEKSVYPEVDRLITKYGKPTATMTLEHQFVKQIISGITESGSSKDEVLKKAQDLLLILNLHTQKEEEVYFPLLRSYLSEKEQEGLLHQMHKSFEVSKGCSDPKCQEQILDVRNMPPPQRHPLIFKTFDETPEGRAFILVNDHDPKPLYYSFLHEREGMFEWEYLEKGPEDWRVKISRK
jgi:uncharacterized protein (DUF2249 family)/hemerythrin-like domain-containing protein